MMHRPARPAGRILLDLSPPEGPKDESLRDNLSVAGQRGRDLWVASDETAALERLTTDDWVHYGHHRTYRLDGLVTDLQVSEKGPGEVDIEGIGIEGDHIWLVGSHSLARKRPKPGKSPKKAIAQLHEVKRSANRHLLARLALDPASGEPVSAAWLAIDPEAGSALTRAVEQDRMLAAFLAIPAKENGFDIEGLAVRGERVYLGLRGPVLRGWAIILDLHAEEAAGRAGLGLAEGLDGAAYAKHFLDLDGLGIRELVFDGDDLLILAGPTMDLDGPVALWRWRDPLHHKAGTIVPRNMLEHVLDVPYGHGHDHAEGLCLFEAPGQRRRLLVVYDGPGPERCHGNHRVEADLFDLPG